MQLLAKPGLLVVMVMLVAATPARSAPCPAVIPLPLEAEIIPPDDDVCGERGPESFAHMAWRTFKYLVWPARSRGLADTDRKIDDLKGSRVFETYKSDWEVFPAPASGNWETFPAQATFCKSHVPAAPAPLSLDSYALGSLDKFDSVTQPGGVGHALMAQNGSLTRYLAAFNKTAFEHIANLQPSVHFGPSEEDPIEGKTRAPDGAITIKSAWIEVRNSIPDRSTFHVRTAWVQDPAGVCRETEVAFVGLHIVHKTMQSQQWVWASFEHVRNSPLRGARPATGFTFHDGGNVPMPFAPPLDSRASPPSMSTPYNVERLHEIASYIRKVNAIWQQALQGSVWSNYQLVVVQWPREPRLSIPPTTLFREGRGLQPVNPAPPCTVGEPGANTANSVMETFLQSTPGSSVQDALTCATNERNLRNTCMGCHYNAHNYDFIWGIPLNRHSESADADTANRRSGLSTLRDITGWSAR